MDNRGYYLAFTASVTPEQAREAFVKRYGVEPAKAEAWPWCRLVVAGPVPDKLEHK